MNKERITTEKVWEELSDFQLTGYKTLPEYLYLGIEQKYGKETADLFRKQYNESSILRNNTPPQQTQQQSQLDDDLSPVWAELSDYQIRAYKFLPTTLYAGIRTKYGQKIADLFEKEYNALKNTENSELIETMLEMNKDYKENPEAFETQKGITLNRIEKQRSIPTGNTIADMINTSKA